MTTSATSPRHSKPCRRTIRSQRCFEAPGTRGSADALADALLNPRDRAYSVPQFLDFIERNGLTLDRWHRQAPYVPRCGAISGTPHAPRLTALAPRQQYAAMELWRGSITAHSAIVRRNDAARAGSSVDFDGDRWLGYVPVRLPSTHLVQERLPPGAAGVLLNRSHPFADLFFVVTSHEKRLFDAIDGRRTIAEIASDACVPDQGRTRTFFEKLWWYDQVVFDASRAQ